MAVYKRIRHIVFGKTFFLANNEDNTVTLWKQITMNNQKSFYPLQQACGENDRKIILIDLYHSKFTFLAYEPERGNFLTFTSDGNDKVF